MTDASNANNEVDNDREDQQLSTPKQNHHRNLRLQSFVDRYGVDEPYVSTVDHIKNYIKQQCASLSFISCLNAFLNKIPLLRCLKEYNIRKNLFGDIIAGITVAIMHIPQGRKTYFAEICFYFDCEIGMAYGVLTTLPPVYGKEIFLI
jgi:solute carrier family 26 protein